MTEFLDEINYDKLVEKALRNVIFYALKLVEDQGLPGENHFYITFSTVFPGVKISKNLLTQYPEAMTIVIQNQFKNLKVSYNDFSVELNFGGMPQNITIPFEAITYFADPSAKFGLSFDTPETSFGRIAAPQTVKPGNQVAQVISIDNYRKK